MKRLACLVALAACGGDVDKPSLPDAATNNDASTGDAGACSVYITFDPPTPLAYAGQVVRAKATVSGVAGTLDYSWSIRRGSSGAPVAFEKGAPDSSAVDFTTDMADSYDALVNVSGCPSGQGSVNAEAPGANAAQLRVRVWSSNAPPQEKRVLFKGGGASWALGITPVDPGRVVTGTTAPLAYLRFMKASAPETFVETFSASDGAYNVRAIDDTHHVLIVPGDPAFAPRLVENMLPGAPLPVDGGTLITGSVVGPSGQAIEDATVQIVIDGAPATVGRTDSTGAFSVRASTTTGPARIEVAAPAASGLPRLVASSSSWTFAQPVAIEYASTIAIGNAGGRVVQRDGAPLANADVALVAAFTAGRIRTGTQSVDATGEVRVLATTNASGVLPSMPAPARVLTVVAAPPGGDATIASVNLAAAPAPIVMPVPLAKTIRLTNSNGDALPGAVLEAVPQGAFALAGIGTLRAVANASGDATASFAPTAQYALYLRDPRGHEMARLAAATTVTATTETIAASYALGKAVKLRGTLSLLGNQPLGTATVQLLCDTQPQCTGSARLVPLAEGRATPDGRFEVAAPDPGTMPP